VENWKKGRWSPEILTERAKKTRRADYCIRKPRGGSNVPKVGSTEKGENGYQSGFNLGGLVKRLTRAMERSKRAFIYVEKRSFLKRGGYF